MKALIVGQTLYSRNINNAVRGRYSVCTPVVVRSVGRKYFSCSSEAFPSNLTRYHLNTWKEENGGYAPDSELYESQQAYQDACDTADLWSFIVTQVNQRRRTSVDNLRRIADLIGAVTPEPTTVSEVTTTSMADSSDVLKLVRAVRQAQADAGALAGLLNQARRGPLTGKTVRAQTLLNEALTCLNDVFTSL